MLKPLLCSTVALTVLTTAACGPRLSGQKPAVAAAPILPAVAQPPALAAAEAFEALTETAFTLPLAELAAAVAKAEAEAALVRLALPAGARSRLDLSLAAMRAAHQTHNRADLALASVEGYRTLVTAAPRTKVPVEVSLLDYAGFRYQADLRAQPARWADMAPAAAFARTTWAALSPQVADQTLRARLDGAVNELGAAVAGRDSLRADDAVGAELGLVDQLETHFNADAPAAAPQGQGG